MSVLIEEMTIQQYDEVIALWQSSEGVGLSNADSKENIVTYLERNQGLSFIAREGKRLVGAVLCGHDGRRGYIHHLAVNKFHRRKGIGRALVQRCLSALQGEGIGKCHVFVFNLNQDAIAFWKKTGWTHRIDLTIVSQEISSGS